jgi:hypothetical protein
MTYKWYRNGSLVAGATSNTCTVSNATPAETGTYYVEVRNLIGAVNSSIASLTIADSVSLDNVSTAKGDGNTLSWRHTVGAANDRMLIVTSANRDGNKSVTGISYGGVALTEAGFRNAPSAQNSCSIWYLIAPAVGSANVVITLGGSAKITASAYSLKGVHQTTPLEPFISTAGQNTSPKLTNTVSPSYLMIDILAANGDAVGASAGAGQTLQWNLATGTGGGDILGAGSAKMAGLNTEMSWALVKGKPWALAAVSVRPAGTSEVPPRVTLVAEGMSTSGFDLQVRAPLGATYVILASSNLLDWKPIHTNIAQADSVLFTDAEAITQPNRYYQAVLR